MCNTRAIISRYTRTAFANRNVQRSTSTIFSAGEHDAIPGWALGWIYCLEHANVDWSSKACWQVAASSQSACGHGLAGLFAADGRTPQHTYWVYRAYGQLPPRRVRTKIANPRTVALAARNDAAHELRILVGRYSCGKNQRWCLFSDRYVGDEPNAPAHVEIKVPAFPYRARVVQVHAQRIPNQGIPGPLAAPQSLPVWNVNVKQGRVTVKLDVVGDGDVYLLTLRPQNLLSDRRAKPR